MFPRADSPKKSSFLSQKLSRISTTVPPPQFFCKFPSDFYYSFLSRNMDFSSLIYFKAPYLFLILPGSSWCSYCPWTPLLKPFFPIFFSQTSHFRHSITATVVVGIFWDNTCTWHCGFFGGKYLKISLFFQPRGRQQLWKQKVSFSRDLRDISREE